jgi:hypothetical protein
MSLPQPAIAAGTLRSRFGQRGSRVVSPKEHDGSSHPMSLPNSAEEPGRLVPETGRMGPAQPVSVPQFMISRDSGFLFLFNH